MIDERHPLAVIQKDIQALLQPVSNVLECPAISIEFYNLKNGKYGFLSNNYSCMEFFLNNGLFPTQQEIFNASTINRNVVLLSPHINESVYGYPDKKYEHSVKLFTQFGFPHRVIFINFNHEWLELIDYTYTEECGLQFMLNQFPLLQTINVHLKNIVKPFLGTMYKHLLTLPEYCEDRFALYQQYNMQKDAPVIKSLFKNYYQLTEREYECLSSTAYGKSAKRVAKDLKISPRTVEVFIERLKEKLNVPNKLALCEKYFMYFDTKTSEGETND